MESALIAFFEDGIEGLEHFGDQEQVKGVLLKMMRDYQWELEGLNVVLVSDEALRRINWDYLGHDYYTDIITFDLSWETNVINGELYVSLPRIEANAEHHNVPVKDELRRVTIHGVLHLLGFDDKRDDLATEMRNQENFYLEEFK